MWIMFWKKNFTWSEENHSLNLVDPCQYEFGIVFLLPNDSDNKYLNKEFIINKISLRKDTINILRLFKRNKLGGKLRDYSEELAGTEYK